MSRKLVTIRKVLDLISIEGADFIELAKIGGWQCIVKKGEFKEGDLGLYFEIDSFLPEIEQFEYLRKGNNFKRMLLEDETEVTGFRLRTIKLRGQLSQGLLLPLTTFPDIDFNDTKKDYSEELRVIKWEPPISPQLQGIVEGYFPTDKMPKTSQERIQNLDLEKYQGQEFHITEKMHGQSMTVYKIREDNKNKIGVCSRNLDLKESKTNLLWQTAYKYKLIEQLNKLENEYAVQGELCGEGINKNIYGFKGHKFLVFDVYNITKQRYLSRNELDLFCKTLSLEQVPYIKKIILNNNCEELINSAFGQSLHGDTIREGLVFTEKERKRSFKVISNTFLLQKGE